MAPKHTTTPNARRGKVNRVQFNQKPRVDASTLAQLETWQKQAKGVSVSVLLDRLVAHAKRTKFHPGTDCL